MPRGRVPVTRATQAKPIRIVMRDRAGYSKRRAVAHEMGAIVRKSSHAAARIRWFPLIGNLTVNDRLWLGNLQDRAYHRRQEGGLGPCRRIIT
jgi:hypothetical protein